MEHTPRTVEQPPLTAKQRFYEALAGWRSIDGDHYCPDCWPKFVQRMTDTSGGKANISRLVEQDSVLSRSIMATLQAADGWFVDCHDCERIISEGDD